ncbi:protein O-mannosyl-transferase family [Urechidicola vernalis]|uniref:DUF2723 domain-containing protein n=1 Tax=Urechidicola vernalis TaxID=3075600 RepID=A0ABU2Y434_9FLAO|nr:DUF2723 domain-containing protein [Urechidicola sp. P050]MDT0552968.1 DUF2723 domain-containing protein [Urechidicola sp. P050]
MSSLNYSKLNTILGWSVFAIALLTYTLTLEPTVSYWDCGEYISTAVKLEIGHPPGAPLFQILGAFFAMFTSDVTQIAAMVNFMSALSSAFTILFLFWTITALAKKVVAKTEEISGGNMYAILGSGLVGSLAYCFSDSFWFSAVEGEVYAMSSFLMALLFWLGIRWEAEMHKPKGNKWLLIISFVVGLSFGVHILSLLVIPSLVLLYFFKNYKSYDSKKFIIGNIASIAVLLFIFKFLFPFTLKYFSALELFFINTIGLPFNTGSIIAMILLVAGFYFGLNYTRKKNKVGANTLLLSVLFVMIGFSSWLMLPIRANANTTINENNPSSARELLAYYNREQYGDASVFYDKYYSLYYKREQKTDPQGNPLFRDDKPKYEKNFETGKYVIVNDFTNVLPDYSDKHKGLIPRMVDPSPNVIQNYKAIAGIPQSSKRKPTMIENVRFMIDFQFGYMYGRYFMWNFVGRQNDIQGNLDIHNGNWISGINFIDSMRLGPQSDLPDDIKNNKGRNTYFFLPLILGLIGVLFHLRNDKENFYTLLLFFVFTGLAIIFYTNPKPFEPRERDYAVVGSFYVFAVWIGFGVLALYQIASQFAPKKIAAFAISGITLLAVPVLMAQQNWDDHDRSNRYTSHLNAKAYLDSCAENAIMFTIGDNDTFPLWYMQEVENYRTDIKLVNTSLFATDWYIDQMKRATYEAPPIPSQLTHDEYKYGTMDLAYHYPLPQFKDSIIEIDYLMRWIQSKNDVTYVETINDKKEKTYPTNKIRIPVDKAAVLASGLVKPQDADLIVPYIDIEIDQDGLTKNRILMLDILANNNWKHPIYFTGGASADEEYIWLKDYLQSDGLVFKFVPIYTPKGDKSLFDMGRLDAEINYNYFTNIDWKNINDGKIYLDTETRKNAVSMRNNMLRLVDQLILEGDSIRAEEIIDLSLDKMPVEGFLHYGMLLGYPEAYYRINKPEKARILIEELAVKFEQNLVYYSRFDDTYLEAVFDEIENNLMMYDQLVRTVNNYDTEEQAKLARDRYVEHIELFSDLLE